MRSDDEQSEDGITSSFEDEMESLESEDKIDDINRGKEMHGGVEKRGEPCKEWKGVRWSFSEDSI